MENNFIPMAASAGHAVAGSIFKDIIDCVQLYFINGFILSFKASIVFGLSAEHIIFDGIPQRIIQRYQIAVPRWPNDISSAADNAIFKNRGQNIECSFGCVASSAVLLKPNVINILLFNFCEQKFVDR